MNKNFSQLPLRTGVGIILLNNDNKVFVARRIDNAKKFWQIIIVLGLILKFLSLMLEKNGS